MNPIDKCIELTEKMIKRLYKINTDERDSLIVEIEDFLEQRSLLLSNLEGAHTLNEEASAKKLLLLNKELDELFKKIRQAIHNDLNDLKKKRESAEKYSNPYASAEYYDGYFYDKKN